MALSIKLAEKGSLCHYLLNILLAQSGISATPLVFFFILVYVCGVYTRVRMRVWVYLPRYVHVESRRGIAGS